MLRSILIVIGVAAVAGNPHMDPLKCTLIVILCYKTILNLILNLNKMC